jgi:undecaprenyl-diphosphatase
LLHLVILALVQGITEFLPISSSGHLVLTWQVLGSQAAAADQLVIDIAVHVGTLAAVCGYFRRDLAMLAGGVADGLRGRPSGGTPPCRWSRPAWRSTSRSSGRCAIRW